MSKIDKSRNFKTSKSNNHKNQLKDFADTDTIFKTFAQTVRIPTMYRVSSNKALLFQLFGQGRFLAKWYVLSTNF